MIGVRFVTLAAIAALLPTAALAAAAEVDTSEWKCEFCPFAAGYEAQLDVGADYVSDDAARFGNASGYDEGGAYVNFDGAGYFVHDDYQLRWNAHDLGLDSRVLKIDGGRQGQFGFRLGYSELPYRLFDSTSTVFTATDGNTLALPAGWVRSGQTSGFTSLATSLQRRDIASDRQTMNVGGHFLLSPGWRFSADYRHQERDGIDIVAGANFIQGSLLPRVLDWKTDVVDLGVAYAQGPLNMSLVWTGSSFNNKANSLTWGNPFRFPGAERGRQATEPDNKFQQFALSGAYAALPFDTVIAFSVAMGEGEQEDRFVPYTINTSLDAPGLPRASLGGKVDTANYAFTVTARPQSKLRLKLSYRFDERDNRTPRSQYARVIVDGFLSGDNELNTPYSFEKTRLDLSGRYRLFDDVRLGAGYKRVELDRNFQEVAEQTEDTGWGSVDWHATDWLDIDVTGGTARRDIDRYDTTVAQSLGQNPLLRKYNLAYRYRRYGEMTLAAAPPKLPVTVAMSALWTDDSYSRSRIGLTDSKSMHYNVDLNWTVSERMSVYLFGGEESTDAAQAGSTVFAGPNWFASHEDDFRTLGGGVRLDKIGEKASLRLDYTRADGETEISMTGPSVGQGQFPALDSSLDSLRLNLDYRHSDKLNVDLSLRYERFETSDWALAGVAPDTIATVLALGAQPYDYNIWVLGVSFRYAIGARESTAAE